MTGPRRIVEEGVSWVLMRTINRETPGYHGIVSLLREDNPYGVKLLPRDIAVWLAIVERLDYRTGQCDLLLECIAADIGMAPKYLTQSVKRLKDADLLIAQYNPRTGRRWHLVNPVHLFLGSEDRNRMIEQEWLAAKKRMTEEEAKEAVEDSEMAERIANHNRALNLRGA